MDFRDTSISDLAAIVSEHLQKFNIEVVLVGGLAVEIYTENLYLTKDIDLVNVNYQKPERLNQAMSQLGFYKQGRVYINVTTDISVEFPPAPLSVGDELISDVTVIRVQAGDITILKVTDVVKDRLAAFIHWHDNQSLVQAVAIINKHRLKPETFELFCLKEGSGKVYEMFKNLFQKSKEQNCDDMSKLESLLAQIILDNI